MPITSDTFHDRSSSSSDAVTWIHIGDSHLTRAGETNEVDLGRIVDEINAVYANGRVDFVYVPGDIADDGSPTAYQVFRKHLDRLNLPWFGIVGDHDVHEKSFANFRRYVDEELFSAFWVGRYRVIRLNAFSDPLVAITRPADIRLVTSQTDNENRPPGLHVRAKAWSSSPVSSVEAEIAGKRLSLRCEDEHIWSSMIDASALAPDTNTLQIHAVDASQRETSSRIQPFLGQAPERKQFKRDQDNTLCAWEERGLLGTQLGPNKNGRKW